MSSLITIALAVSLPKPTPPNAVRTPCSSSTAATHPTTMPSRSSAPTRRSVRPGFGVSGTCRPAVGRRFPHASHGVVGVLRRPRDVRSVPHSRRSRPGCGLHRAADHGGAQDPTRLRQARVFGLRGRSGPRICRNDPPRRRTERRRQHKRAQSRSWALGSSLPPAWSSAPRWTGR